MIRALLLSATGFWTERTLASPTPAFDVPVISGDAPFAWAGPIAPGMAPLPINGLVRFRLVALHYGDGEPDLAVYLQEVIPSRGEAERDRITSIDDRVAAVVRTLDAVTTRVTNLERHRDADARPTSPAKEGTT